MKNLTISRNQTNLSAIFTIITLFIVFIPTFVKGQADTNAPSFKVFTNDGEVNLDKGIKATTQRLLVKAIASEDQSDLKFMVTKTNTILVANGLGRGTIKAGSKISLSEILKSNMEVKGAILLLEILEYQSKNEEGTITTIEPEKPIFIKIPLT